MHVYISRPHEMHPKDALKALYSHRALRTANTRFRDLCVPNKPMPGWLRLGFITERSDGLHIWWIGGASHGQVIEQG